MGAQRGQHGYHAGLLRAGHRRSQGVERHAENRVRESADRGGEDGRGVHVLLRSCRRERDNATDTVLRAEKRHVGARRVRQDGILEGEDQAGIWRQLLQSCKRRNLRHYNHLQSSRRRLPGVAKSRGEEILGFTARSEETKVAAECSDAEGRWCLPRGYG